MSLRTKWVFGTWIGMAQRSNEHLVALPDGGAVIRVRTVKTRTMDERWNAEAIERIVASPRRPNPKDDSQEGPQPERMTKGADPGGGEGKDIESAEVAEEEVKFRNFKITKALVDRLKKTPGCKGCEGIDTGIRRDHSMACRRRLEEEMMKDDVLQGRIRARDDRLRRGDADAAPERGKDQRLTEERKEEEQEDNDDRRDEEDKGMKRGGDAKDDEEEDEATRGAKKSRVDEARAVKVRIEKGKAEQMAYRRVTNVTKEIKTIIEDQFPSPHEEAQMQQWKLLYEGVEFHDDMNGYKPLVKEMLVNARTLEMEYFRKMRV